MPLKSRIPKIVSSMRGADDRIADSVAAVVEAKAHQVVPVDTGALNTSIETFGATGSGERIVEAGQSLWYAPFVEYGTSVDGEVRIRAQPFMRPAAEEGRRQIKTIAKYVVEDATK